MPTPPGRSNRCGWRSSRARGIVFERREEASVHPRAVEKSDPGMRMSAGCAPNEEDAHRPRIVVPIEMIARGKRLARLAIDRPIDFHCRLSFLYFVRRDRKPNGCNSSMKN